MADEHATLTLTLTDEMSEPLAHIKEALEALKRSAQEAAQEQDRAHQRGAAAARGHRAELEKISPVLREIHEAVRLLPDSWQRFGRTMADVTQSAGHFITAMRLIGGGVPAMGAGATMAATAFVVLGNRMEAAAMAAAKLRKDLGESSDAGIVGMQRMGDRASIETARTMQIFQRFAAGYHDLARGIFSSTMQMWGNFGPIGLQIAQNMKEMERAGVDASEALRYALGEVGKESEVVRRQFAQANDMTLSELDELIVAAKEFRKAWKPDPAEVQRYEDQLRLWGRLWRDIKGEVGDLTRQVEHGFFATIAPAFGNVANNIYKLIDALDKLKAKFAEVFTVTPEQEKAIIDRINRMNPQGGGGMPGWLGSILGVPLPGASQADILRRLQEQQQERERIARPPETLPGRRGGGQTFPGAMPRQAGGAAYGGMPYLVGEKGPELFVPQTSGNVLASASGGPVNLLRDISQDEREGNEYLREMRDVLAWMRDMMEKPAAAGGGVGAGRGGGGAGWPWGRGPGGEPQGPGPTSSNPQGPPADSNPQTPQTAWPSPAAGNVMPPGFGAGGGLGTQGWLGGGLGYLPGATQVPPGWGPGGSGKPWGAAQGGDAGGGGGLAALRSKFGEELKDPATMELFRRRIQSEDASDPQAFAESVMNRAVSRGWSLKHALSDASQYYPVGSLVSRSDPSKRAGFEAGINAALGGSNITRGATGNASLNVGFGYGRGARDPYTYRSRSGERYGIEQKDVNKPGYKQVQQAAADRAAPATPPAAQGTVPQSPSTSEVDDYLWQAYQRSSHTDSTGAFGWKDEAAAKRAGMSLRDYVIGGMDPAFKEQLYRVGKDMEAKGMPPMEILSAYRDNYRQDLASGFKAGTGGSWHGNTPRTRGYGHGAAADVDPATAAYIARQGRPYGLTRPMPGADPLHVQPTTPANPAAAAAAMRAERGPLGQSQVSVSRSAVDKSIAGQVNGSIGKAQVDVNFNNVPPGTKVAADGEGVLKDIRVRKTPAMNNTTDDALDKNAEE